MRHTRTSIVTSLFAAALLVSACASAPADTADTGAEPSSPDTSSSVVDEPAEPEPTADEPAEPEPADTADTADTATSIQNCDVTLELDSPPQRVLALNSPSVEVLLALGLADRIVAAVGDRDGIRADLQPAYDTLEVVDAPDSNTYPSVETLLEFEPDFIYSVYPSAFREESGIMTRTEFSELGINTYLSPNRCADAEDEVLAFQTIWDEWLELGSIFDVEDTARDLVADQQTTLADTRAAIPHTDEPISVFWWDVGVEEPMAGVCCNGPGMIMRELGLNNIFDDIPGSWAKVSWEAVIDADPDVVVMADFGDDDIATKLDFIRGDETLSLLSAFANDRFVVVPFGETTPGLKNADAVRTIGAALADWGIAQ